MEHTDHPCVLVPFCAKEDAETLCGIIRGDQDECESVSPRSIWSDIFQDVDIIEWSAKWQEDGQGLMGSKSVVPLSLVGYTI